MPDEPRRRRSRVDQSLDTVSLRGTDREGGWRHAARVEGSSTATFSLLLLVGVSVRPVRAQAILEGKVTGTVTSEDGVPLPGATVEISSPALLAGTRSATTSAKGRTCSSTCPRASTGHRVPRRLQDHRAGEHRGLRRAVVTLDLTLPVGTVRRRVTVTAEGPIVDTKTSTIDSKIDQELLAKAADEPGRVLRPRADDARHGPRVGCALQTTVPEPHRLRQRDERERLPDQRRQRHQSPRRGLRLARQRQLRHRRGGAGRGARVEGRVRELLRRGDRRR